MKCTAIFTLIASLGLAGCITVNNFAEDEPEMSGMEEAAGMAAEHPEAALYTVSADPVADVDAALAHAAQRDTRLLLVMGANWCHDSRGLAGWLETERFAALVAQHYELVYVNVGMPRTGDAHNLHIAQRFGVQQFNGTPAVLVVTPEGLLVNPDTATTWNDAASRSEDAIYQELHQLAHAPAGMIMPTPGIEIAQ
jgi:hypothetical protein